MADEKGLVNNYRALIAQFSDLEENSWYYYELIEATNTHEFTRRDVKDEFNREYEDWIMIINR